MISDIEFPPTRLETQYGRSGSKFYATHDTFYKVISDRWEFLFMRENTLVFPMVEDVGPSEQKRLHIEAAESEWVVRMPRYIPHHKLNGTFAMFPAVKLLPFLWSEHCPNLSEQWHVSLGDHLLKHTPDDLHLNVIRLIAFLQSQNRTISPVRIHGDPTVANIVHRQRDNGSWEWKWVDPLRRIYIPQDPHVDLGKLYQSACGYEAVLNGAATEPYFNWSLMQALSEMTRLGMQYGFGWMIVHYIRLLRYQSPANAKVFLEFVRLALDELYKIKR